MIFCQLSEHVTFRDRAAYRELGKVFGLSASYAVESYQSLFLKTYYGLEFMTAGINNFGGFYCIEGQVVITPLVSPF